MVNIPQWNVGLMSTTCPESVANSLHNATTIVSIGVQPR